MATLPAAKPPVSVKRAPLAVRKATEIEGALTFPDLRRRINLIQETMRNVMKKNVHYGTIPGCPKPSLYKAGSEVLLTVFQIALRPMVEDLSTGDEARYRVTAEGISVGGVYLGGGVGECSSDEEKYRWRRAVCQEEWDEAHESRRRVKWARGQNGAYSVKQVRMEHADVRNTVLKMAKKRAQIDMTLTVTGASDMFTQDIEDLPEGMIEARAVPEPAPAPMPQRKSAQAPASNGNAKKDPISDPQRKRMFAIAHSVGWKDEEIKKALAKEFGIEHSNEIPKERYDAVVAFFQNGSAPSATSDAGDPFEDDQASGFNPDWEYDPE